MERTDVRVSNPICTPGDIARLVHMPPSTVYSWMKPTSTRDFLVHSVAPSSRGWPSIPLLGLAEAFVIRGLRTGGMKMPELAFAVAYLREKHGPYALASPGLVTDGVVAMLESETGELETLRGGQGVLMEAVRNELRPFRLAPDGFVEAFIVPEMPGVEMDPRFSSGRMRFTRTGVPLFAVAGLLEAGDPVELVADEYDLRLDEVELVRERLPWLSQVA